MIIHELHHAVEPDDSPQFNRIEGLDLPQQAASKYTSCDLAELGRDEDLKTFLATFDRMVEQIRES